ncbi:malonyl-CoA synthase [Leptothrix ochracea]|uniref:malonate--CoA ligase n=1 Tax=Leptothrix ochracea TaxID=735331 RepID=UPI0034E263A6
MNQNLYAALRAAFPKDLNRIAIRAEGPDLGLRSYTWLELETGSATIANLLAALEIPRGSRIAVYTDKSVETLMLYLATLRAGMVYLPLNVAYQPAELSYFLDNAEPAVVVCPNRHHSWISRLAYKAGVQHVFTLNDDGTGTLLDTSVHGSTEHHVVKRSADDLAAIIYTSGTTGRSKGAMLSHGNLLSNALTLKTAWDWQPGDVLLHALPIFHVHGLFVAIHGALLNGSTMLWLSKFDPQAVLARLPRATVFMGVPTLYTRLLQEPGLNRELCAGMRLFISGSAPLRLDTFKAWQERTGHTLLERYGMSETLMLTSNPCRPEDGERMGGTVGKALPGVDIRVIAGHVQVRGPNIFKGYWAMPEKTNEAFVQDPARVTHPWFRTGDVGFLNDKGYLTLVGRSSDMIITGGYNVYPAEVEAHLNAQTGVFESAVVGVMHPDWGEGVVAVVVLKSGHHLEPWMLQEALRDQIASYKVPKHVVIQDELPRNAMGKVQKKLLREQLAGVFATMPGSL